MDGLEATRIIREKWTYGPWIVIVTALDIRSDICFDSGADDVLAKPLRIEQLRDTIKFAMPISSLSKDRFDASSVMCGLNSMKAVSGY
jgi:DNA-binding response OmpR family regulator